MKITKIITAGLMLLATMTTTAQERYFTPLGRMYDLDMQASVAQDTADRVLFTAMKPVLVPTDEPLPNETRIGADRRAVADCKT